MPLIPSDPTIITVYLDSADYSNLSHPGISAELARIRDELKELSRDARVSFCFSSVALFESSPVQARDCEFAASRIALASELCGSNAMLSVDRVIEIESEQIRSLAPSTKSIRRDDGQWFPDVSELLPPLTEVRASMSGLIQSELDSMRLNRAQRRAAAKMSRSGLPRISAFAHLPMSSDTELASLPLRRNDAATIQRYMAGQETRDNAEKALLASLADLPTLAKWISNGNDMSLTLAPILRQPAATFTASAELGLERAAASRKAALALNPMLDQSMDWTAIYASLVEDFISKQAKPDGAPLERSMEQFEVFCPAMTTAMHLMFLQFKKAVQGGRGPLVPSDFGDCLHAMYAPYVSIFRGDKRTTPDLGPSVARWGTSVTKRIEEVPALIKARMMAAM